MSSDAHTHGDGGHASVGFYWMIGIVLAIITAVEVAVFYMPVLSNVLVPVLLTLSAAKFVMVVMFFMHLKFDSKIFSGVCRAVLGRATVRVGALILLYRVLPNASF